MTDNDRIEANKLRAISGWIADPPPSTPEPLPAAHINKWVRMMGATYLIKD